MSENPLNGRWHNEVKKDLDKKCEIIAQIIFKKPVCGHRVGAVW